MPGKDLIQRSIHDLAESVGHCRHHDPAARPGSAGWRDESAARTRTLELQPAELIPLARSPAALQGELVHIKVTGLESGL
jgi:hypothetical protein